jgi:NH3-dependent NAD+ synthetase
MTYGSNKTNEDIQEILEKIHCPVEDLSITTFTNSTHNNSNQAITPNKSMEDLPKKINPMV